MKNHILPKLFWILLPALSVIAVLFVSQAAFAQSDEPKIAVVDYKYLFDNYYRTIQARKQLDFLQKGMQNELELYRKNVQILRVEIAQTGTNLSLPLLRNKYLALILREEELASLNKEYKTRVSEIENKTQDSIRGEIQNALLNWKMENQFNIIFDAKSLIAFDPALDRTIPILRFMNNRDLRTDYIVRPPK